MGINFTVDRNKKKTVEIELKIWAMVISGTMLQESGM